MESTENVVRRIVDDMALLCGPLTPRRVICASLRSMFCRIDEMPDDKFIEVRDILDALEKSDK